MKKEILFWRIVERNGFVELHNSLNRKEVEACESLSRRFPADFPDREVYIESWRNWFKKALGKDAQEI